MSNLTTPIDPLLRSELAGNFKFGLCRTFAVVEGYEWKATKYTGTHLATGQPVREFWALGHGDSKRMYVTADGSYYID